MKLNATTVGVGVCGLVILLTVILIPASIKSVQHDEYAVRYDGLTRAVYDEVYDEGKYIFTPQTKMFTFSNLVKKFEIELQCLTQNGIEMLLDVDVQYIMSKNAVFEAFEDFGDEENAAKYLELVIRNSIHDTCGSFTAKKFYESRTTISVSLADNLKLDVARAQAHFNVTSAVLASYDFPTALDTAITEKRAAENDIAIAENEREGALVEAQTLLLSARVTAEELEIEAQAEQDSILAEAEAQALAVEQLWQRRANVYLEIMNEMNISVDRFVTQYLASVVLLNADGPVTSLQV